MTQRRPWARQPASDSALMVANGLPLARSGAALAKAPKITSMTRRMVSVYPPTGRGAETPSSVVSGISKSIGARHPALAGTSMNRFLRPTHQHPAGGAYAWLGG